MTYWRFGHLKLLRNCKENQEFLNIAHSGLMYFFLCPDATQSETDVGC